MKASLRRGLRPQIPQPLHSLRLRARLFAALVGVTVGLLVATCGRADDLPDVGRVELRGRPLDGDAVFDAAPPAATPTPDELFRELESTQQRLQELEEAWKEHQDEAEKAEAKAQQKADEAAKAPKKWFEKLSLRGYTQLRLNEVFADEDSPARQHHVGDASIGDNQNFLIRRARLILFGDINEYLYLYFQPDFAVTPPGSSDAIQFAQIRDLYADIYIDVDKVFRFRVGQSKVPYGWENLQSSQNRLPLDRNDGLNSAVRNERDLGVFFYWTPLWAQDVFKYISDEGLKGSGNYGVLGFGTYNGQGGSFREQNDDLHLVARLTLPIQFANDQIVEVGMQGYTGEYAVLSSPISPLGVGPLIRPLGTLENGGHDGQQDERLAWSFIYYPQPLGFQAEWTIGRGPALSADQTRLEDRALYGGYAMAMYRLQFETQEFWPFARYNYYQGGYKSERNAPYSQIEEWEVGLEWQINSALEVVGMYTFTDRTNTTAQSTVGARSYEQFEGSLIRLQLQFNY